MALFTAQTSDANRRALVQCEIFVIAENPGANQSTVRLIGRVSDNSASFGGNSVSSTWNVTLDGTSRGSGSIAYDFTGNSGRTYTFFTGDFTVNHNGDGTRSVPATAYWAGNDGLTGSATASGTIGLSDYNRGPSWIDNTISSSATAGVAYSDGVSANAASSYGIVAGQLPLGLSLNTSTGAITGTPTTVESQSFTIRAYGTFEGSIDAALSINVAPVPPIFGDGSVVSSASVGVVYNDEVTASGSPTYSVFSGALPTGLTLNTSTGTITGTPSAPGVFTFVIRATNASGSTDTGTLTITVISAVRVWNGTAFVSGLVNVWNGTAFVSGTIRVWNGSAWVNTN